MACYRNAYPREAWTRVISPSMLGRSKRVLCTRGGTSGHTPAGDIGKRYRISSLLARPCALVAPFTTRSAGDDDRIPSTCRGVPRISRVSTHSKLWKNSPPRRWVTHAKRAAWYRKGTPMKWGVRSCRVTTIPTIVGALGQYLPESGRSLKPYPYTGYAKWRLRVTQISSRLRECPAWVPTRPSKGV